MNKQADLRILVADDHELIRAGLRWQINELGGFNIVGEARDGVAAIELLEKEIVDILVVDAQMPQLDGFEVVRWARENRPDVKALLLSMHSTQVYVRRAIRAGVCGYVVKGQAANELGDALNAFALGQRYYSPSLIREYPELLNEESPESKTDRFEKLSERQRQVFLLVARGQGAQEIANKLGIGKRTVETHRSRVIELLGLRDTRHLIRFAIVNKIIELDGDGRIVGEGERGV